MQENEFEPADCMIHTDADPSLELKYVSYKTTGGANVKSTQADNYKVFSREYLVQVGLNFAPGWENAVSSRVFEIIED